MPIVAVNVIKVLFVAALYGFLFYVARSMRGHVSGPPVAIGTAPAPRRSRPADDTPPPPPRHRSILVFDAEGTPTSHPLRGTVVLGRGDAVDIRIDDEYASERHASFSVTGDTVTVRDLGSTNGTTIAGQPIEDGAEVASGTTVIVGRTRVVVR